ncbi:Pls/PosA family non-ribosomal peptide synthetase [Streptomyces sp. NBC_00102]|uniref:Pls/PosA family non-ribosomal peptide synthetase n=1 Tax=Streptomyces sp. NBC_00102 TaxID=2975652 RepID=UPI00225AE154|nr:Pls/PosA family non-ribosomal peptide synthetase [Streptomyces sp. NBC_00102]MCX5402028.1 phosphopantetheine-binding protein [Streptomyces sp. NBC_00102]
MTAQRLDATSTGPPVTHDRPMVAAPALSGTEKELAGVLADVAEVEEVTPDSDFFNDLGADSLVMAHFCARVRKRPHLPPVSMRDVYRCPTIRGLALSLAETAPRAPVREGPVPAASPEEPTDPPVPEPAVRTTRRRVAVCGALQLLGFLGYALLLAVVTSRGYDWISAGATLPDSYLRSVVFGAVLLVLLCALPVVAKWLLVGRWTPRRFPVWSLAYVRFWLVKALIRSSPMVLFVGSPLYPLYLRALGAHIGRGVTFLSRTVPVCSDLLVIGDGTVVRKDSLVSCYRARDGMIETGPVVMGRDVVVCEATVLDIGTSLGDGSQLGHASSLHTGQAVPDGEHWHGSPARATDTEFRTVGPVRCGTARRVAAGAGLLLMMLTVYVPLMVGALDVLLSRILAGSTLLDRGQTAATSWTLYADVLAATAVAFSGAVVAALVVMATLPRVLGALVKPGRTYPLFGLHHAAHRATALLTNRNSLTRLFGDSAFITHYLRRIGYDLSRVEQTGSNFGTRVKHESPFLSRVGTGTMVADGLSLMNAEYSSTSFRLSATSIGAHNFLGNRIAYPPGGRTGDNCLLATKVMVPVDGPLRHDVGLLGSPPFEIPRSVLRDSAFDESAEGDGLRRRLTAKARHNAVSMAAYLFTGWLYFFLVTAMYAAAASLYPQWGTVVIAAANAVVLPFTFLYFVLVERIVTALHPPGPLFCSIYDRRFWHRERYWKVPSETYLQVLNGTPFKNVVWRLLGVRIGSRVFDDGCGLTERAMVTIGDGCTLNAGSVVQCHSQEDGAFKSDRSVLGSGCTLGVGALVHYGVTVSDGAELEADSFLMKGETVPEHARWAGNPARPVSDGIGGEQR